MKLLQPVDPKKYAITQWFGTPRPDVAWMYKELQVIGHNGIDFACPMKTPIYAANDGVATTKVSSDGAWSITIVNSEVKTFYTHLSKFLITDGQQVKAGDKIALSGNSGKYTTGPHLHFGTYLMKDGKIDNYNNGYFGAVDPAPFIAKKYNNGTFIKTNSESKVFLIQGNTKWWIKDEKTFYEYFDVKVGSVPIEETDLITYNNYKNGVIELWG